MNVKTPGPPVGERKPQSNEDRLDGSLAERVHEAEETERRRIGSELHDGVAQHISVLGWGVKSALQKLDADDITGAQTLLRSVAEQTDQVADELRRVISGLLPAGVQEEVLFSIQKLCEEMNAVRPETQVRWSCSLGDADIPATIRGSLYRIIQEAAHNALRHANATRIDVRVQRNGDGIRLMIRDNGDGGEAGPHKEGNGLKAIRRRTEATGGSFTLKSKPKHGTCVEVCWPPLYGTSPF